MKNYFSKINNAALKSFTANVRERFKGQNIRSDISFLRCILQEVTNLFRRVGGQVSNKGDIPAPGDYPDSVKFNNIIQSVDIDLEKLFAAQKLVETDINNLINFNSSQRLETFDNISAVQQDIYTSYIKNKKGLNGETILEVNFTNMSQVGSESNNVLIDEIRSVLTLRYESKITKPVDVRNVQVSFADNTIPLNTYPNIGANGQASLFVAGSHWKRATDDPHFVNLKNASTDMEYKSMMVDDPDSNTGVGWSEFEVVDTLIDPTDQSRSRVIGNTVTVMGMTFSVPMISYFKQDTLQDIKSFLSDKFQKSANLMYVDKTNSLQSQYAKNETIKMGYLNNSLRVVIPFTNASRTNQIQIAFRSNEESGDSGGGIFPKIIWSESKVWSSEGPRSLVAPNNISDYALNDGRYICLIAGSPTGSYIIPTRLELVMAYDSDPWQYIPFYMSHYSYSSQMNFTLPTNYTGTATNLVYGRTYDIFVDTEADEENEKNRAVKVLEQLARNV